MNDQIKPNVSKEETFDRLEIRLGQIVNIEQAVDSPKASYILTIDFGRFGIRKSVGRFTSHRTDELLGKKVICVLNFEPRTIGNTISEVLVLGVQFPKAESGEATIITPLADAKIGGKLF